MKQDPAESLRSLNFGGDSQHCCPPSRNFGGDSPSLSPHDLRHCLKETTQRSSWLQQSQKEQFSGDHRLCQKVSQVGGTAQERGHSIAWDPPHNKRSTTTNGTETSPLSIGSDYFKYLIQVNKGRLGKLERCPTGAETPGSCTLYTVERGAREFTCQSATGN